MDWKVEEGKNRESEITVAQKAIEYNDSGVLEQFVDSQLGVAQDGAEKPGTKSLTGMNWDGGNSSVLMPEKNMAASGSNDLETDSSEDSHNFLALQPGNASHTEICWMPTSSSGPTSA
jgi:hypothetical protein